MKLDISQQGFETFTFTSFDALENICESGDNLIIMKVLSIYVLCYIIINLIPLCIFHNDWRRHFLLLLWGLSRWLGSTRTYAKMLNIPVNRHELVGGVVRRLCRSVN